MGGHPLDFGALLRKNVALELEDVGDDTDKAFLMGTVLIGLVEHGTVRDLARGGNGGLLAPVDPPATDAGRARGRGAACEG